MGVVAGGGPKDVKILGAKKGNDLPTAQQKQTLVYMPIRSIEFTFGDKFLASFPQPVYQVIRLSRRLLATGLK